MRITLLDDEDLKRLEDTIARGILRGMVSAVRKVIAEGLLTGVARTAEAEAPVAEVAEAPDLPTEAPGAEPAAMDMAAEGPAEGPPVPVFLKPPPEQPFPPGKASEPPPLKGPARTKALYAKLYKTVPHRPDGFVPVKDAAKLLGINNPHATLSLWLQKGELEAVIVADRKPTKGLPGQLMINRDSLRQRDQLRQANRGLAPSNRRPGGHVAA